MLDYMSKIGMYEWFQQTQGWNRMDFLCNLIRFCNPFELRFLGSCIEDKAQMDYNCLRDQEIKANSAENLDHFISKCPPVDEFRGHISICLSLLQSSNYKVARKLADLLDEKLEGLNLEHLMQAGLDAEVDQWMMILTLASYHPAFGFEKKVNFKEKLAEYERLNKRVRKSSRCWSHRPHRCSQQQHSVTKYSNCDDGNWRTEYNPPIPPFQHYPMYQNSYGYPNYSNDTYAGKPQHGNIPPADNFVRSTNFMRPSNFPTALMPLSGMGDTNFFEKPPQDFRQNSDFAHNMDYFTPGYATKVQKTEQRSMLDLVLSPPSSNNYSEQNYVGVVQSPPNSSVLPCTVTSSNTKNGSVFSSSLSTMHNGCCSSTNSVSTVTSTTSDPGNIQQSSTLSSEVLSHPNANPAIVSANYNQFIPIPNSQSNELESGSISNKVLYETGKFSPNYEEDLNKNNMQTEELTRATKMLNSSIRYNSSNVRTSVSMPSLDHNSNTKINEPFSLSDHDISNLRKMNVLQSSSAKIGNSKPLKVSVRMLTRNKKEDNKTKHGTCFKLKVEWSDGTTSESEKTIEEVLRFCEQISKELKKSSWNTDFLLHQQNQVKEKGGKLEKIFREILSTISSSEHDKVISFFSSNNNFTPNLSSTLPLKKRKFKQGPKYHSESGSSSGSTSSPLLNNNNSRHRLLSADKNIQHNTQSTSQKMAVPLTATKSNDCDKSGENSETNMSTSTNNSSSMDGSLKTLETELKGLKLTQSNIATTGLNHREDGRPLDVRSLPDDVLRIRSEDERSGSSQTVPFEIPNSSSDSIQAMASRSCFSFEFDSNAATVESHGRSSKSMSQKSSENEMDSTSDKDGSGPFGKAEFFYTKNVLNPPGKAWSQIDIAPTTEFLQTVPAYYFPSKSAPPFHQLPYYARVHPDSLPGGSQVVQMLGCYHTPHQVIHSSATPVSVTTPIFTQVTTLPSPMGHKQPQYTYTVATTSNPSTPTQNIGYIPNDKMVVNSVAVGQSCYYNPVPKLQPAPTGPYPPQPLQHNPTGGTYNDPFPYPSKKPEVAQNVINNYNPNQDLNVSGIGLSNGYPETGKQNLGHDEPPKFSERVKAQSYRENGEVNQSSISCYNCGKNGHDAIVCSEPSADEVLGSDFHLKMSQPNNRKGND